MAEPIQFDPRIYGGEAPNTDPVPTFTAKYPDGTAGAGAYVPPTPVAFSKTAATGTPSLAIGQETVIHNQRPEASMLESAGAAFSESSPFKVLEWLKEPADAPDPSFSSSTAMGILKFTPSEDEDKFLRSSKSEATFMRRLDRVKEQREVGTAMGDHPLVSMIVGVADLGYLALDAVGLGVAHTARVAGLGARAARGVASGIAAGGAYALGRAEQEVTPLSDRAVVLNALVNGAAGALAYREGKFVPKDATYPAAELDAAATRLKDSIPDTVEAAVRSETAAAVRTQVTPEARPTLTHPTLTSPAKAYGDPVMTGGQALDNIAAAGGEFGELASTLRGISGSLLDDLPVKQIAKDLEQRAYYHPTEHAVYLKIADLADFSKAEGQRTIVHEIAHGVTSQKLYYGAQNPHTAIGQLTSELEAMRVRVAAHPDAKAMGQTAMYLNGNIHEFVAGLFYGGSEFTSLLSKIPVVGYGSALGKLVQVVRKMLGLTADKESVLTRALGLTEELIAKPLDVRFPVGKDLHFAPKPTGDVAAQIIKNEESRSAKLGQTLTWNLHKTMANIGALGKKTADLLVDDPVSMRGDSVVSQQRAIRSDLAAHQYRYEDLLTAELAVRGAGLKNRIVSGMKSMKIQRQLEEEVALELWQRDRHSMAGTARPATPATAVTKLADAHDAATAAGLAERKAAGVMGSEAVEARSGYFTRKWDVTRYDEMKKSLISGGLNEKQAHQRIIDLVQTGMAKANPGWDTQVSGDVARAIVDRMVAKGYFEDAAFRRHVGNETAKEVRSILSGSGISGERLQRALDAITGATDEAGKAAVLKHRVGIDMLHNLTMDGQTYKVADLIDTSLTRHLDSYLDGAAGDSALARKGLVSPSDIDKLRTEWLHSIDDLGKREQASKLFDNTIASIKGTPVGDDMASGMRKLQAVTQMVGLASSGLWQLTETATIMAKYGMVKSVGNMIKELPGFRGLLGSIANDATQAEHLSNVLARNSAQDIRVRPYVSKLEDNFDMPIGDSVAMALTQAKQLVPYINAMRYVHHGQARLSANLITDTFSRAANGDTNALKALNKYGLESHTMDGIRSDIIAGGLDTAKWSDNTWAQVRGPLTKMMDDAVLHSRTGEIPAFAQFSQVGKFVFTFRSFVLASHNKILAGTLGREGFAGLGLLMAYQYPLTFLATAANEGIRQPQKQKTTEQMATAALGQMGSLGLFGEFAGVITGDKQQFGAPGLIPIDRMYKVLSSAAAGNSGNTAAAFLNMLPILSVIPGTKALSETLKD